jgi:hypothetical protein
MPPKSFSSDSSNASARVFWRARYPALRPGELPLMRSDWLPGGAPVFSFQSP